MDNLGNINAREGIDRCTCGCKYWENDRCVDCDTMVEVVQIRHEADTSRFLLEVSLNTTLTTWTYYAGLEVRPTLDLVETTNRYRDAGVIS